MRQRSARWQSTMLTPSRSTSGQRGRKPPAMMTKDGKARSRSAGEPLAIRPPGAVNGGAGKGPPRSMPAPPLETQRSRSPAQLRRISSCTFGGDPRPSAPREFGGGRLFGPRRHRPSTSVARRPWNTTDPDANRRPRISRRLGLSKSKLVRGGAATMTGRSPSGNWPSAREGGGRVLVSTSTLPSLAASTVAGKSASTARTKLSANRLTGRKIQASRGFGKLLDPPLLFHDRDAVRTWSAPRPGRGVTKIAGRLHVLEQAAQLDLASPRAKLAIERRKAPSSNSSHIRLDRDRAPRQRHAAAAGHPDSAGKSAGRRG